MLQTSPTTLKISYITVLESANHWNKGNATLAQRVEYDCACSRGEEIKGFCCHNCPYWASNIFRFGNQIETRFVMYYIHILYGLSCSIINYNEKPLNELK